MKKAEERALNQIEEMRYADGMYVQGYQKVIKYGAVFYLRAVWSVDVKNKGVTKVE